MAEPDATQIIAGPGLLYVAPLGTALPAHAAHGEIPITWPAGWVACGYTDAGIDFHYSPTIKKLTVDEEASPVGDILETEMAEISATLAEATLANLTAAISASSLTTDSVNGVLDHAAGSKALTYTMVGVQGPAPGTEKGRILIFQKAIAESATGFKMTRKEKVMFPVKWAARKLSGVNLYDIWDYTSSAS